MSNSRRGIDMIYSNHFMGGNRVLDTLDNTAKKIGLFRNVVGPLAKAFGIKSPKVEGLIQKGYGRKRKTGGKRKSGGRRK